MSSVVTPSLNPMKSGIAKPGLEQIIVPKFHRIRITLTSRNKKIIEKMCTEITKSEIAKGINIKGPVRMPNKVLRITTRKTPCGEGSKTWDHFELSIYKRVIDLIATAEQVKAITNFKLEAGVHVEITIADN